MNAPRAWEPAAFEARYAAAADPWDFRSSPYERERFGAIIEALGPGPWGHVLEPACSNGELTALLAERSTRVTAFDVAPTAVALAGDRCAHLAHVELHQGALEEVGRLISEPVDTVVFAEVGYYFTESELAQHLTGLRSHCRPGARFVACHWLGHSADHRIHGRAVHRCLVRELGEPEGGGDGPGYRLDWWVLS